jgi:hypothetical protein
MLIRGFVFFIQGSDCSEPEMPIDVNLEIVPRRECAVVKGLQVSG